VDDLVGKRILIVEDAPSIGLLLGAIITEAGCKVIGPAGTSVLAIEMASLFHIDAARVASRSLFSRATT
jgi:DNA-binding response OmpR family regulator